jgi:hypothetical protein
MIDELTIVKSFDRYGLMSPMQVIKTVLKRGQQPYGIAYPSARRDRLYELTFFLPDEIMFHPDGNLIPLGMVLYGRFDLYGKYAGFVKKRSNIFGRAFLAAGIDLYKIDDIVLNAEDKQYKTFYRYEKVVPLFRMKGTEGTIQQLPSIF